ncbi:MAG: AAA family ATPase, partial [Promethearchaeota archaeon]
IQAFQAALQVRTLETLPIQYATTQNDLGIGYCTLAEVKNTVENCHKAIQAFQAALEVRTLETLPIQYATSQNNLGTAYYTLAGVENTVENSQKAIQAFYKALKVYTSTNFPIQYATSQNNLGTAYYTLAEVEDTAENCHRAIQAFQAALQVRTLETLPIQYATTQNDLGIAYRTFAEVENKAENCQKAIQAFHEALKVYTLKDYSIQYAFVQQNLESARAFCEQAPKLRNIKIERFKSLFEINLPLKRLNLFIGPNNSGKSSILQSLLLLNQSYQEQKINFHKPYNFGGFNETIFNKQTDRPITINLIFSLPPKLLKLFNTLGFFQEYCIVTDFDVYSNRVNISSYLKRIRTNNSILTLYECHDNEAKTPYFNDIRSKLQNIASGGSSSVNPWLRFSQNIKISEKARSDPKEEIKKEIKIAEALNQSIKELNEFYEDFFTNVVLVPVNRGNLSWVTKISGQKPKEVDNNDEGHSLYNTLFHMMRRQYASKYESIKRWTREFGINDLTPYPKEAQEASCGVETIQQYTDEPFQLVSLGFGTRQLLLLLVKSIIAPYGSTILIEEPEIHLHPAYQLKIIDFLLEMLREEKQVFVTTHSEHLILRLQNVILEGRIGKDDVGIFYTYQEDGRTKIKELEFKADGSYEMPGFYDVTQNQLKEWLRLKTKREEDKNDFLGGHNG